MRWFVNNRSQPGWTALNLDGDQLAVVQGIGAYEAKPKVFLHELRPLQGESSLPLGALGKQYQLKRAETVLLLRPGEYQMVLIEAPKVAPDELRQAIRWPIKDLLDHPVEDVTLDVLDIPVLKDDPLANHNLYVVAAPNALVEARMRQFEDAKLPLAAIDIPETAQRNIAALYEEPGRSTALLHIDDDCALLTISHAGELYFARRMDINLAALTESFPQQKQDARERLLLELQRSMDHFERQYRSIPISRLVLGPMRNDGDDVDMFLAEGLGIGIETVDLRDVIEFPKHLPVEPPHQARIFHAVGASLRLEAKAA